MLRQRHEARSAGPLTAVFGALTEAVGEQRWGGGRGDLPTERPRVGLCYTWHRDSLLRRGRIVEYLRPVVLTLNETLIDAPCRVRLRLRWRLEPFEGGAAIRLDVRYELNGPAYWSKRRWREQIRSHCVRTLARIDTKLKAAPEFQGKASSGQRKGNSSMTVTNTTIVNGRPTLR
jgi:hypothetical protein